MPELRCATTDRVLIPRLAIAPPLTWRGARGLIGRTALTPDEGLLLHDALGCIHTFGMRLAIDVAFCARDGEVLEVVEGLVPRRVHWRWGAPVQVEVAAGRAAAIGLAPGCRVRVAAGPTSRIGGHESHGSPHASRGSGRPAHDPRKRPCAASLGLPTFRALSPLPDGPAAADTRS